MQTSQLPVKFPVPFAKAAGVGYIRPIPLGSQIGIIPGAASLNDGFPPLTFLPVGSGGIPPFGQDFNGLFNQITSWNQWQQAGGGVFYDATFVTQIGGYPKGCTLVSNVTQGLLWLCIVENNTTNPDAGGSGWLPMGPAAFASLASGFFLGTDTGTANAMLVAATVPVSVPIAVGMVFLIKKSASANTSTINLLLNGITSASVIWADGSVCQAGDWPANTPAIIEWDGTVFRILSVMGPSVFARVTSIPTITGASLVHYGTDTGTANAISVATVSPTVASVTVGMFFEIQKGASGANSGAMTANIAGQGGSIIWPDGSPMGAGDWPAAAPAFLMFDSLGNYRMMSMPGPTVFARVGGPSSQSLVHYGVASGTNTLTSALVPALTAPPSDGTFIELSPSNNNTGAATLNPNGQGAMPITLPNGSALLANQLIANQISLMVAKGGSLQLVGGAGSVGSGTITQVQVFTASGTYFPTGAAQKAVIIATGGGGGGGCSDDGSGGGSGATAIALLNLSGVVSVLVTIGAGGSGQTRSSDTSVAGGNGGTTQFGSFAVAGGGTGGSGMDGSGGAKGGNGGTASAGLMQIGGGDGGSTPQFSNQSGKGGASFWGGGGWGSYGVGTTDSGHSALAYGAGGGGGDSGSGGTSGSGAAGVILVLEF